MEEEEPVLIACEESLSLKLVLTIFDESECIRLSQKELRPQREVVSRHPRDNVYTCEDIVHQDGIRTY
jgi:hypothetical protein